MEEGKGRNNKEGTSKKDKATDRRKVKGADVGEVEEGGQIGRSGPEGCGCAGEDSQDEVKDSRGRYNFLARI